MRTIKQSAAFKKDVKRESKGPNLASLNMCLPVILAALANDEPLPAENKDHALIGNWAGYRECHIKHDLLLVYRKPDGNLLRLARLGTHSVLFGK
jgi:mRNA interferase YafQ